jgi:hypothetical protein
MCGRTAGHLWEVDIRPRQAPRSRRRRAQRRSQGNLLVEPEKPVSPTRARQILAEGVFAQAD